MGHPQFRLLREDGLAALVIEIQSVSSAYTTRGPPPRTRAAGENAENKVGNDSEEREAVYYIGEEERNSTF